MRDWAELREEVATAEMELAVSDAFCLGKGQILVRTNKRKTYARAD
jgi:hypothetical protein